MPELRITLTSEQLKKVQKISRSLGMSPGTLLRPRFNLIIAEIAQNFLDAENAAMHQKVILRAMRSQNTTIEELVEWTGLERVIVVMTLSELLDAGLIRRHVGHRKIVNWFLIEN